RRAAKRPRGSVLRPWPAAVAMSQVEQVEAADRGHGRRRWCLVWLRRWQWAGIPFIRHLSRLLRRLAHLLRGFEQPDSRQAYSRLPEHSKPRELPEHGRARDAKR